jgi:cation:H+ antiporter
VALDHWVHLLGGGVLLYFGADWFVGGASALALALRIPQIIIGLTVVAYGTSAPEIIVGVEAALSGRGIVALGNVIGSNIANIGLILGVAALIKPARVHGSLRERELPVLLVSTALLPLLLLDSVVSPWEGALLLLIAASYTAWMVQSVRSSFALARARSDTSITLDVVDAAGSPRPTSSLRATLTAITGLLVLLVGGNIFIGGAVSVARTLGMSDQLVGLTIVAVGTSLPELVTSIIAARRGHSDIAVGNVVGSNIFNILLCLGASALAGPVGASLDVLSVDLAALIVMTLLVTFFIRNERNITRPEAGTMLLLYVAFTALVVARG